MLILSVVQCTSNPSTLHIISACTLATLCTIPSASLVSFAYPQSSPSPTKHNVNDVTPIEIDHYPTSSVYPRPIYSLSNRLLAYVSPLSRPETSPASTPGQAHTVTSVPAPAPDSQSKFGLGLSQADLGNAAVKLGGTVFSGMKALGGMAFSAARAGVTAAVEQGAAHARATSISGSTTGSGSGTPRAAFGMFFSKSAPAATASPHEYQTPADRRRRRSLRVSPVDTVARARSVRRPPSLPARSRPHRRPL